LFSLSESLAVKNEPGAPSIEAISLADKAGEAETGRRPVSALLRHVPEVRNV
jgi:hypothetical protein